MDVYNGTTDAPGPDILVSAFLGVLLTILSVVTLAGNIGTIWAFRSNVHLRQKPSNLLILSLSCCDLVVGATGLPMAAIHTGLGGWPLGKPVCIILAFCSVIGVSAGMYSVTAISLDRWLLVSSDYSKYLRIQSLRNVKIQIGAAWGLAILISSCETILWIAGVKENIADVHYNEECRSPVRESEFFIFVIFVLLFAIPFIVMIISTAGFAFLLRRRLRRQRSRAPSASVRSPNPQTPNRLDLSSTASEEVQNQNRIVTISGKTATQDSKQAPLDDTSTANSATDKPPKPRPAVKHPTLGQAGRNKSFFGLGSVVSRGTTRNRRAQRMKNRYIKPAVRLAILLGVFALCTLPYPFFLLLADKHLTTARNHLSNLLLANSGLNPFLYAIMHRKIRQFYASKITPPCWKKSRNM